MIRRLLYFAALAAVIAGLTWALWPKPVAVETVAVGRQAIDVTVEEEGKSRIREIFTVSAPTGGKLQRLNLHAGDRVIANITVLAYIHPAEPSLLDTRSRKIAEAAAEAAKAAVDLADAKLREAQAQQVFMKGELGRATELVHRGAISLRSFDKAILDAAIADAAVESARANLLVQRRNLESAEAALIEGDSQPAKTTCCVEVKSPVSGSVLRVVTESEQVVQPGTALLELGDPTDLEIAVELLSRDAVQVKPGAAATIIGWGGNAIRAEVTRVDPAAVTKISALGIEEQRVEVVLKLLDPPETWLKLGHGFRTVVSIVLWHGDNLLAVPMGALFRSGDAWAVYTVAGGMAHLTTVELGQRNFDVAEVKSGLAEGDKVILHPSDAVGDGVRVQD